MRDFFIQALDKIVSVMVILGAIAVLVSFFVMLLSHQGGILPALGVLIFGSLYLIAMGGLMYLFLGIYANTKRMADLLERGAEPRTER